MFVDQSCNSLDFILSRLLHIIPSSLGLFEAAHNSLSLLLLLCILAAASVSSLLLAPSCGVICVSAALFYSNKHTLESIKKMHLQNESSRHYLNIHNPNNDHEFDPCLHYL